MARRTFWVVLILSWLAANLLLGQQMQFHVVGNLGGNWGAGKSSQALGVSGDGQFVVGDSLATAALGITTGTEAFYLATADPQLRLHAIGFLPDGDSYSSAHGVSQQARVIVGECQTQELKRAFRWTQATGLLELGVLPGHDESVAWSVSGNGEIVVGQSSSLQQKLAFRWTNDDKMISLGDLPGGADESTALDISRDGTAIVGYSRSEEGTEAFLWRDGQMQGLGSLPGARFGSRAYAVSADGKVVVGEAISPPDADAASNDATTSTLRDAWVAFRWTKDTGMQAIGDLPGGKLYSKATGVSADGKTVVGIATSDIGSEPFLWTADGGMKSLQDLLDTAGLSKGFRLQEAWGISDDGKVIIGVGQKPMGNDPPETAGWILIR